MALVIPPINRKTVFGISRTVIGARKTRAVAAWYDRRRFWFRLPPYTEKLVAVEVPGKGFLVTGGILDPKNQLRGLNLILSDGSTRDLDEHIHWSSNEFVAKKYGMMKKCRRPWFAALAPTASAEDACPTHLELKMAGNKRRRVSISMMSLEAGALTLVQRVLRDIPQQCDNRRALFDNVLGPAIQAIWSSRVVSESKAELRGYNENLIPDQPDVSLIIPIYGRYDFIEYQLGQFVNDADMRRHEILYVIDDPRLANEIRQSAESLSRIYRIGFRVLYLSENLGFAGANNAGVQHACGNDVLLLNSDVMPSATGWVRALLDNRQHEKTLTGARLLYEDHSIQHDGMAFHDSPFMDGLWTNIHPGKGMPSDISAVGSLPEACEAVTGACILVNRKAYEELGGLDTDYILGDYEDSDFCMRARQHGFAIVIDKSVQLFHLERQSQSLVSKDRWKEYLTYYNCWQHTNRWHDAIVSLQRTTVAADFNLPEVANG